MSRGEQVKGVETILCHNSFHSFVRRWYYAIPMPQM